MTEIVAGMGSLEKTIKKSASPEEAERAAIREPVVAARARGEDLTGPDGEPDGHCDRWPQPPPE
jgi:putative transposase